MFPYTHAKPESDVFIHFIAESFQTTNLEVVNPSSDELVEFHYLVAVANTPTTTCSL